MKRGWMDFGWSPRKKNPDGPELHDLSGYGGWILTREQPMTAAQAGGLTFTYQAPAELGEFLELKLDKPGTSGRDWEKVRVSAEHKRALGGGAVEVFIPMSELNPKRLAFDRIVFFAFKEVPKTFVAIDDVALTAPGEAPKEERPVGKPLRVSIDCRKRGHTISPLIYGIGGSTRTCTTGRSSRPAGGGAETTRRATTTCSAKCGTRAWTGTSATSRTPAARAGRGRPSSRRTRTTGR
jgi:hypothetical protein